jgi:hypothetical protein
VFSQRVFATWKKQVSIMSRMGTAIIVLGVAFSALGSAGAAKADGPYGGCGIGFCYPFYAQYGREHIPYFALHPPVYYSYPVPRTYGYSPFAYPFGSPTPEIQVLPAEPAKPKMMSNPYVPGTAPSDRVAQAEPQIIYNPYVSPTRVALEAK